MLLKPKQKLIFGSTFEGWQNAVNALRVDYDCEIYLTGSNAYLLSSGLSTYLSGRYVEIQMLPLSFAEYALFCDIRFSPGSAVALGADGHPVLFDDLFRRYLFFGGMPATAALDVTQGAHAAYMSSMYDAVAVRDIINRERERGKSRVTDPRLLRSLATFLLYEGWTVHVGKLYSREVDSVAVRDGERRYVQVTDNMMDERTRERELAPLRSIRDAFPKMVVVREGTYGTDVDGIRIVGAREFFLPDAAQ